MFVFYSYEVFANSDLNYVPEKAGFSITQLYGNRQISFNDVITIA